jgi:hypothetical protein
MSSGKLYFACGALAATLGLAAGSLLLQPAPLEAAEGPPAVTAATTPASYANFCRVIGTPEEVVFDFGLNAQGGAAPPGSIEVSNRIVMSYYTAKRMSAALELSIQRHEAAFGEIETDINKRLKRPSN